jgi:hypothetical protein
VIRRPPAGGPAEPPEDDESPRRGPSTPRRTIQLETSPTLSRRYRFGATRSHDPGASRGATSSVTPSATTSAGGQPHRPARRSAAGRRRRERRRPSRRRRPGAETASRHVAAPPTTASSVGRVVTAGHSRDTHRPSAATTTSLADDRPGPLAEVGDGAPRRPGRPPSPAPPPPRRRTPAGPSASTAAARRQERSARTTPRRRRAARTTRRPRLPHARCRRSPLMPGVCPITGSPGHPRRPAGRDPDWPMDLDQPIELTLSLRRPGSVGAGVVGFFSVAGSVDPLAVWWPAADFRKARAASATGTGG